MTNVKANVKTVDGQKWRLAYEASSEDAFWEYFEVDSRNWLRVYPMVGSAVLDLDCYLPLYIQRSQIVAMEVMSTLGDTE